METKVSFKDVWMNIKSVRFGSLQELAEFAKERDSQISVLDVFNKKQVFVKNGKATLYESFDINETPKTFHAEFDCDTLKLRSDESDHDGFETHEFQIRYGVLNHPNGRTIGLFELDDNGSYSFTTAFPEDFAVA